MKKYSSSGPVEKKIANDLEVQLYTGGKRILRKKNNQTETLQSSTGSLYELP
jgi:hypothetical protein